MNNGGKSNDIYGQKKRHIFGELLQKANVGGDRSRLSIESSSKELVLTYKSVGLIVSVNGGGSLPADHPDILQTEEFATEIVRRDGLLLTGGRKAGIMAAAARVAKGKSLGVIFPELMREAQTGPIAIVNSPTPRIDLLATCAPVIVIFRGGLGTFQVLMRAITHVKNRHYHPEQLPQLVFISEYWIGLLSTMVNLGTIPQEFLSELHFFHDISQIIEKIPSATIKK